MSRDDLFSANFFILFFFLFFFFLFFHFFLLSINSRSFRHHFPFVFFFLSSLSLFFCFCFLFVSVSFSGHIIHIEGYNLQNLICLLTVFLFVMQFSIPMCCDVPHLYFIFKNYI